MALITVILVCKNFSFNQSARSDLIIIGKIICFHFAIKGYRQSARKSGENVYVRKKRLKIMTVDSLVTLVLKLMVVSFHIQEALSFSALVAAFLFFFLVR